MPDCNMADAPVIIVGMGSSGSRLLVSVCERLGVFMGGTMIDNPFREAPIFHSGAHAFVDGFRYDDPLPQNWRHLVSSRMPAVREFIRDSLPDAFCRAGYIGGAWGFKDPRTTFVLGAYLEAYPAAVVVHCVRDGRDVALTKIGETWPALDNTKRLDRWFRVWESNVFVAESWKSRVTPARYYVVRYEDMCRLAQAAVETVGEICGTGTDQAHRVLSNLVRSDSLDKWKKCPELFSFATTSSALSLFGYSPSYVDLP